MFYIYHNDILVVKMSCSYNITLSNKQDQSYNDYIFSTSSLPIKNKFLKIWNLINEKTGLNICLSKNLNELRNLVIYDVLDGNRSTICSKSIVDERLECVFYVLNLIHILKALGTKVCYFMIHTSYNRERGEKEFDRLLKIISYGALFIKNYAIKNDIRCLCIGFEKNYKLLQLLNEIMELTKNGSFNAYFLFDYNEKWFLTENAKHIFDNLPDIDVHIRHTKFQVSGGWIPDKMSHSVFLYSQNGTTYSNWELDEMIVLVALALLAKLLHKGEVLNKIYKGREEIIKRYEQRELQLFNKVVIIREEPKKLFLIGSPIGVYQIYY